MIVLKTRITNNRPLRRMVAWANIHIEPNETVTLEGAYPTACRMAGLAEQMEADVKSGDLTITIVTDLNVERISQSVFPKTAQADVGAVRPVIQRSSKPAAEREAWAKEGRIEDHQAPKVVFAETTIKTPPGPTIDMDARHVPLGSLNLDSSQTIAPVPVTPAPVAQPRPIKGQRQRGAPIQRESAFSSSPVQQ